jgi:hypothetical protein
MDGSTNTAQYIDHFAAGSGLDGLLLRGSFVLWAYGVGVVR